VPEPILEKAAKDLGLQVPIEHAYYGPSGSLCIVTRYEVHRLPPAGYGKTDTLAQSVSEVLPTPHTGSNEPGSQPTSGRPLTGGSPPPKTPAGRAGAEPEPPQPSSAGPSSPLGERLGEGDALDDFTAIDGVGPVTAQKLHDLGYYTYDDLRLLPDIIDTPTASISSTRIQQIQAWLAQRPV
jgi:hypothetical protein